MVITTTDRPPVGSHPPPRPSSLAGAAIAKIGSAEIMETASPASHQRNRPCQNYPPCYDAVNRQAIQPGREDRGRDLTNGGAGRGAYQPPAPATRGTPGVHPTLAQVAGPSPRPRVVPLTRQLADSAGIGTRCFNQIGRRFRRAATSFAKANDIPWVKFGKDDVGTTLELMRPHLDRKQRLVSRGWPRLGWLRSSSGSGLLMSARHPRVWCTKTEVVDADGDLGRRCRSGPRRLGISRVSGSIKVSSTFGSSV